MANFCKNSDCPPSQDLLAFQTGEIEFAESKWIRDHLTSCEFCASEVDFYERYPLIAETTESEELPKMPEPLFELATALIGGDRKSTPIERLIKEIDEAHRLKDK
jgi:hypothetical protein